jgi:hypothetical protein
MRISNNEIDAVKAFYLAEAGVEHSIADLIQGGTGDIGMGDIDGNAETDYMASVNWDTDTISAGSFASSYVPVSRGMSAQIKQGGFSSALQVGGQIIANVAVDGTINGDVNAGGAINKSPSLIVNGTETASDPDIIIPAPSFAAYEAIAPYRYYSVWPSWESTPPDGDGIYYIDGNLNVLGDFTLNGTLVVTGYLQITNGIDITPTGDYPAIIAGTNIDLSASVSPVLNGLVYAGGDINFSSSSSCVVNGAIVAGGDLTFSNMTNINVTFNEDLNPPDFSGENSVTITNWKGERE